MKAVIFASLIASAVAFAPASNVQRSSTALCYEKSPALPFLPYPENLKGYVGDDAGFDPFRFSDFVPVDFLREAELKHGRIAMLAYVGFVAVDLGFKIYPTPEAYEGLTSVTAHDALVEQGAMGQIFLWTGLAEVISTIAVVQMLQGSGREPGYFGFDPLGFLNGKSDEEVKLMKMREIQNGRLAMLAFSGIVTQAVLTQGPFPYV
uniref:Plastid light harvesting protein n=1 Tax=Cyclophora tenuis TaxID=216820 RepID=A0A7S1DAW8_CYCTE|mmetsp:Transcript_4558/g.7895  ORF Transcript_4558/g.7895 Transcript_4558/m.7895 type:complete len:206 (+) Transcript_4558:57-674(+)|eukprot:CAMPEP_0116551618 /NCGR_PEP_ID=MMETSP0397-20121206/6054_1 /TAXON_ID=216820 /ORGANISM="Cyclophora tenuis, Strain ECT3854" /LENGTH=205 /DNA_ID=CAMNT_0004076523 /DNA_START=34 /DNA_END=651 /DNA_ORIENTATION=+